MGYAIYSALNEDLIVIISLGVFFIAALWGTFSYIHRVYSYDEVCIYDGYFIVKNKKRVISKNKLDELEVISFRAWFEIFGIYQLSIKVNGKLLFHYSTSEIAKLDNEKLINKLKEGVELWQNK